MGAVIVSCDVCGEEMPVAKSFADYDGMYFCAKHDRERRLGDLKKRYEEKNRWLAMTHHKDLANLAAEIKALEETDNAPPK